MADHHSTYVALAKTILPLLALALLSTMFLFARAPTIESVEIPYADIEELAREQQISAPSFSGVTDDGSIFSLMAESARPVDDGDVVDLAAIRGTLDAPGGATILLRAGEGRVDTAGRTARLSGLTRIETSDGYEVETNGVFADLDAGRIETDGALEAHAPYGELTAGRLVVETPDGGSQLLNFQDGVRLVYRRQQQDPTP
ncbi:hypothetical protein OG2516_10996 [Oceanicola granulosus HTCC2516]|uniref:Lipopolysaccharide export system protein LptC n=1 Tax=Oceanicola granulosus (strain ATCC BAA-861 / DSM 15982 / KCTC 12143 / HTCC2516) TaxID=314256 RepID=Q2CK04_OCEGH|nr:hypothetical protein [Oceanicola granulosus]EAR52985.1 hypothetical protein OG2516_10996 [Oceanicola granulosus HTCC2516]